MTLDADVVRSRCGEIEQALERLGRIRADGRVFDVLENDLEDLRAFSRAVAGLL